MVFYDRHLFIHQHHYVTYAYIMYFKVIHLPTCSTLYDPSITMYCFHFGQHYNKIKGCARVCYRSCIMLKLCIMWHFLNVFLCERFLSASGVLKYAIILWISYAVNFQVCCLNPTGCIHFAHCTFHKSQYLIFLYSKSCFRWERTGTKENLYQMGDVTSDAS